MYIPNGKNVYMYVCIYIYRHDDMCVGSSHFEYDKDTNKHTL